MKTVLSVLSIIVVMSTMVVVSIPIIPITIPLLDLYWCDHEGHELACVQDRLFRIALRSSFCNVVDVIATVIMLGFSIIIKKIMSMNIIIISIVCRLLSKMDYSFP